MDCVDSVSDDVRGDISLTSSPAQVKPPGDLVKLSCQVSGYKLTDYGTGWIRHRSGRAMEWIGIIWGGGGISSGDSFKSRFSISRDTNTNVLFLQINNLELEDSGVYYCAKTSTVVEVNLKVLQKPTHGVETLVMFSS